MALTIQEYAARALEERAEALIAVALATPEDQREWRPLDRGRTARDQMVECAALNGGVAALVRARAWDDSLVEKDRQARAALDTMDKAARALRENTRALTDAVRATPDEHLATEVPLPWLEAPISLADLFLLMLWNMSYHEGQIVYIQHLGKP